MLGPSVRDVMVYGYETFPNAPREWPGVQMDHAIYFKHRTEMFDWCKSNLRSSDWYNVGSSFYFTSENDATLFRLVWA